MDTIGWEVKEGLRQRLYNHAKIQGRAMGTTA